jgi:hypothetical protein
VVVTGRVEALPLAVQPCRVELGVEDALLVPQRAGQVRASLGEDRGAAAADRTSTHVEQPRERKSSGSCRRAGSARRAIRKQRDSRAMCTSVDCHSSLSSAVEATYSSIPDS